MVLKFSRWKDEEPICPLMNVTKELHKELSHIPHNFHIIYRHLHEWNTLLLLSLQYPFVLHKKQCTSCIALRYTELSKNNKGRLQFGSDIYQECSTLLPQYPSWYLSHRHDHHESVHIVAVCYHCVFLSCNFFSIL